MCRKNAGFRHLATQLNTLIGIKIGISPMPLGITSSRALAGSLLQTDIGGLVVGFSRGHMGSLHLLMHRALLHARIQGDRER